MELHFLRAGAVLRADQPYFLTHVGFMAFRQKTKKDSNLRILSFDQRIVLDAFGKHFGQCVVLQNVGVSQEYF